MNGYRIRLEGDAVKTWLYLTEHGYPHPWTAEALAERVVMIRVEHVNERVTTAGYAWATWHDELPHTLDFHVCIAKPHRARWFSVLPELYRLSRYLGAEALITTTPGDRAARLVRGLLVRRYGYTPLPDGSLLLLLEDTDGLSIAEEAEVDGARAEAG